jgi:hypothetical protein
MAMLKDPDALGMFSCKVAFLEGSPPTISTDVILPVRQWFSMNRGWGRGWICLDLLDGLSTVAIHCRA